MSIEETLFTIGINGGLSGGMGYAAGRITRMAVDVIKWIVGAVIAFQLLLSHLGIITIHFDRATQVANELFGTANMSTLFNELTQILFTVIPSALGVGAGFYAGYKKINNINIKTII